MPGGSLLRFLVPAAFLGALAVALRLADADAGILVGAMLGATVAAWVVEWLAWRRTVPIRHAREPEASGEGAASAESHAPPRARAPDAGDRGQRTGRAPRSREQAKSARGGERDRGREEPASAPASGTSAAAALPETADDGTVARQESLPLGAPPPPAAPQSRERASAREVSARRKERPRREAQAAAAAPTPKPETRVERAHEPRAWNLWELERIVRAEGGRDPTRADEWAYLFLYLRAFADPNGTLPPEFDGLVRESLGSLLDRVAQK